MHFTTPKRHKKYILVKYTASQNHFSCTLINFKIRRLRIFRYVFAPKAHNKGAFVKLNRFQQFGSKMRKIVHKLAFTPCTLIAQYNKKQVKDFFVLHLFPHSNAKL